MHSSRTSRARREIRLRLPFRDNCRTMPGMDGPSERPAAAASAALAAILTLFAAPVPAQSPADSSLPEVIVEAQRQAIEKQAHGFVKKLTGSAWAPDDAEHLLGMWRIAICPLVAGLQRQQGQIVFDRVTAIASAAGAHLGAAGCHPNLFIVVTTRPEELLSAWHKRDRRMFGDSMPATVKRFLYKPLPVRVWYNTVLAGADGDLGGNGSSSNVGAMNGSMGMGGAESGGGAMPATSNLLLDLPTFQGGMGSRLGSRLGIGAVHDLSAVIAVVDFKQMEGYSWLQLADYISMMVLTNVDPNTSFASMPSILALFNDAPEARPKGLTEWDSAYLNALYHTDRMSPLQRVAIVQKMVKDIDPAKVAASTH
jgi:hypothetical protein